MQTDQVIKYKVVKCIVCGTAYKQIKSKSLFCSRCESIGGIPTMDTSIDDETLLEIELLKNPSGKTKAKIENEGFA